MKFSKFVVNFFILIAMILFPTNVNGKSYGKMDVHLIDVGQGDSILIITPNDKVILIDGGPPKAGEKVVNYLKKHQVDQIDLMIATHPHKDHIGGLPQVINELKVKQIIDNGKLHATFTYAKYINEIRQQKIPRKVAQRNEEIHLDPSLSIQVLNAHERTKNNNQSSIVLKVTYKNISFLFLSDIEAEQEKNLAETYDVQSDLIKVAHHGSKTSSTLEFLKEADPKVALLTYSKSNRYGHPVSEVIENLNVMNTHIYSTAAFGDVVIHTNGKSFLIFTEYNPIDGLLEQAK